MLRSVAAVEETGVVAALADNVSQPRTIAELSESASGSTTVDPGDDPNTFVISNAKYRLTITIDGDRVRAVGLASRLRANAPRAKVIDLRPATLTPGLTVSTKSAPHLTVGGSIWIRSTRSGAGDSSGGRPLPKYNLTQARQSRAVRPSVTGSWCDGQVQQVTARSPGPRSPFCEPARLRSRPRRGPTCGRRARRTTEPAWCSSC